MPPPSRRPMREDPCVSGEARRRGRPPRLTRDEIVRAARELLARDGVDGITMRALARAVGSTPMSLYHHVADKDELLLLLLEDEADALRPPPLPDDPRARIVTLAGFLRDVLDARPWVLEAVVPGTRFGRGALPLVEQLIGGFVACGLRPEDAARAYRALWHLIVGELSVRHARQRREDDRDGFARETMRTLDPEELPLLAALGPRWREIDDAYDAGEAIAALVDGLIGRHGSAAGGAGRA